MRKKFVLGELGLALAIAAIFPFTKSDAAFQDQTLVSRRVVSTTGALPDFDIRLAGIGEFSDFDLTSNTGKQLAAQNTLLAARSSSIDQFRAGLKGNAAQSLRATLNESGAVKSLFIEGAALSLPSAD